jgi:hypothetical protein
MRRLRGWIMRFGGLFNKDRKDRELKEELESHIQLHTEDNIRSGMTPVEARRQAMIKFGGIESVKEGVPGALGETSGSVRIVGRDLRPDCRAINLREVAGDVPGC